VVEIVVNSGFNLVRQQVEVDARLADEIAMAEFNEAMRDPNGSVSVRLVEHYIRITKDASRAERSVLCDRVEASRRLGAAVKPGTITERVND